MIYPKRADFSKPWPLSDLCGNCLQRSILYAGWGLLDDVRRIIQADSYTGTGSVSVPQHTAQTSQFLLTGC